jgi:ATP-dependent RNA helicase MSS116
MVSLTAIGLTLARLDRVRRTLATSAAAEREVEEEEDFFAPSDAAETPSTTPTTPEKAEKAPRKELARFSSLRGSISYDTLKALTVRPFKFVAMSEVQRRVLGLLPELVGGTKRAHDQPVAGEVVEASEQVRESGETTRKEDLLVKAKTGTGKTIVGFS